MKATILITIGCLLSLVNGKRVILIESTCNTAECNYLLMNQVKRFNSIIECKPDNTGSKMISSISHRKPEFQAAGIYCHAFTVTNTGREREISDFTRSEAGNILYLHVGLTMADIQNLERCRQLPNDQNYFNRECQIQIIYYNMAQESIVKRLYFTLTVRIPRRADLELLTTAKEIIEHGCDCEIDAKLTFQTKIYRGEGCQNEITSSVPLTYGEYICFGIFGADDISRSSVYEIGSLSVTYRRAGGSSELIDMMGVAIIKCSLQNVCVRGQIYIIVPMLYVGDLDFSTIVVLRDLKRMLQDNNEDPKPKGGKVDIGAFTVTGESFGYGLAVSMSIILGLLIAIL